MRKLLCLLLLVLCLTAVGFPAVTNIQTPVHGAVCNSGTSTCTVAFGSSITATSILVACGQWAAITGTGFSVSSFTDTLTNTFSVDTTTKFTHVGTAPDTEVGLECGHTSVGSSAGADTVTCHFSSTIQFEWCVAFEITPGATWDNTAGTGTTGTTGTALSAGSFSTTVNGEFGITAIIINDGLGNPGFMVAGAGWTINQNDGTANQEAGDEFQAQASSGTLTGNITVGAAGNYAITMMVFKPSGVAAKPNTHGVIL